MGRRPSLDETETAGLLESYEEGFSVAYLAQWYGLSQGAVYQTLRRNGVTAKHRHPQYADTEDMRRMRDNGSTYADIGKLYGLTKQAIHQRLSRRGQ